MEANFKVKLLSKTSKVPFRHHASGDVGYDLFANNEEDIHINVGGRAIIPIGIAIEIPDGHYGRIAPRSGLAVKFGIDTLAGVIDRSYRGEVKVILSNTTHTEGFIVKRGDKVAQIILEKCSVFPVQIVAELSTTSRGDGGFGSTDDIVVRGELLSFTPTGRQILEGTTIKPKTSNDTKVKKKKITTSKKQECFFRQKKGGCHPVSDMGQFFGGRIYVCHNHRNISTSQFQTITKALTSLK